jgi:anti-anti-sigma factor
MGEAQRVQPLQGSLAGRAERNGSALRVTPPAWRGDSLRLSGEADVSTVKVLRRALQALQPSEGVLLVDLTGLEFIDARSVRLFVSRAVGLGDGERMVLQGARGLVGRVLRLLAVENLAPITVLGPQPMRPA